MSRVFFIFCITALAVTLSTDGSVSAQNSVDVNSKQIRIATFNCSLNREAAGGLIRDLSDGTNPQARKVAAILRTVRPQIVLLNEFDFDSEQTAVRLFLKNFLEADADWCTEPPLTYSSWYTAEVNTGIPSGRDLDHDGKTDGPGDALGFGRFPGQYGMVVLSQFPIDSGSVRTFRKFLWKDLPGAALPPGVNSGTVNQQTNWYSEDDLSVLRLSSKSHWDVPIRIGSSVFHLLASHPTPPAFDGPEDRNGRRNHDEIRFWAEYLSEGDKSWLRDDSGVAGSLPQSEKFVLAGDQNADPQDGGSYATAIQQLLRHPRINSAMTPTSRGGEVASALQKGANLKHQGDAKEDTADFSDRSVGNLRADYVLPDKSLQVTQTGVFWPPSPEPGSELVSCSDHRLVWIDVMQNW